VNNRADVTSEMHSHKYNLYKTLQIWFNFIIYDIWKDFVFKVVLLSPAFMLSLCNSYLIFVHVKLC
jgi:hypothetical protein